MKPDIYGVMGRYSTPEALLDAIHSLRRDEPGLRLEAYVPYAVEGLDEALGLPPSRIPLITLAAGLLGALGGFFMQWYAAVISFPVNIGGRPLDSWPMFIPVTFELAVLCAACAAVAGMLWANGLPCMYHPAFNAPGFDMATRDRYFLCLRPAPGARRNFDPAHCRDALARLGAEACADVRP